MWPRISAIALALLITACDGTLITPIPKEENDVVNEVVPEQTEDTVDDAEQTSDPIVPDSSDTARDSVCVVSARTFSEVESAFAAECGDPDEIYRDCDQYATGQYKGYWACADAIIGELGPDGGVGTTPYFEPEPPTDIVIVGDPVDDSTDPVDPVEPVGDTDGDAGSDSPDRIDVERVSALGWLFVTPDGHEGTGALEWRGANAFKQSQAGAGLLSYTYDSPAAGSYRISIRSHITNGPAAEQLPADKNNDVWFRVGTTGTWTKLFHQKLHQWADTFPTTVHLDAGVNTLQLSGRSQYFIIDTINIDPVTPVAQSSCLIVAEYDVGPDPDDRQAIIAGKLVMDQYTGPCDFEVIVGTVGDNWYHNFQTAGLSIANDVYEGTGVEVTRVDNTFRASGIATTALNWSLYDEVIVAAGGPMSFTADVLRAMPSGTDVTVVQHSPWNQNETGAVDLAYVQANTNYIKIGDGNGGGTSGVGGVQADLNETRNSAGCQAVIANRAPYVDQWELAQVISNDRYCDFSDTVELLYIVGDTSTKTMVQFVNKYMK